MKLRNSFLLKSVIVAFAATSTARAVDYYWDTNGTDSGFGNLNGTWGTGGGGSAYWSSGTNANLGTATPTTVTTTTSDTVIFGTASLGYGTGPREITVAGNQNILKMEWGAAQTQPVTIKTTVGTNFITVANGGSFTVNGGNHVISGTGVSGSGSSRDVVMPNNSSTVTFAIAGGSSLEFKARVGQGGTTHKATKTGTGTLIFSGQNGSSGGWTMGGGAFTITAGVVRFANTNATGNSNNSFTVSTGAAMELDGGFTQGNSAGTVTLNGTGIQSNGALRSLSGSNTLFGNIALAAHSSIGVDAGSLTIGNGTAGIISGAYNLTKVGAGTLNLTVANTYSGSTTISAGTLNVGNGGTTGSLASATLNLGGGTLTYTRTGTNTQSFTTTNVTAGSNVANTTVSTNTLALGNMVRSVGSTLNIGITGTVTTSTATTNGILGGWALFDNAGTISNWATHTGSGTDIVGLGSYTQTVADMTATDALNANLNLDSSHTMSEAINANSLRFSGNAARTLTLATGTSILQSGGILVLNAVGSNASEITGGQLAGAAGADLIIHQLNTGGALTISSAIVDNTSATGLTKSGAGNLILSGANTYTGATFINAGTVTASNIVVSGGSSNLGNATSAVNLGSGSAQGTLSYAGSTADYTRGFTISAGGGRLDVTNAATTLTASGSNGVTGRGLFTVGGAGNTTITSNITHSGGLTKADAGTLTLSGTNTYTGATTVNGGTLVIAAGGSTHASSAVTVSNSGSALIVNGTLNGTLNANVSTTVSGTGTIKGAATVAGTLAPGASPGTLTFENTLGLSGATLMEIDGAVGAGQTGGHDFVNLTGTGTAGILTYGGALTLDIGTTFGAGTYSWDLFNFASKSQSFATISLADQYTGSLLDANSDGIWNLTSGNDTWTFTESTGVLGLTVIPEPRAALLGGIGLLMLLRRRR